MPSTNRSHRRSLTVAALAVASLAALGTLTGCRPPHHGTTVAPYFSVSASKPTAMIDAHTTAGLTDMTAAFVIGSGCTPMWDEGTPVSSAATIAGRITQAQAAGIGIIISFGGAAGNELASTCTNTTSLTAAYRSVIDRFGVTRVDFDIEGTTLGNVTSQTRRFTAIKALETALPALQVSATLPAGPTGLEANGVAFLNQAKTAGVRIDLVNIMTMDYGDVRNMGQTAVGGAMGTLAQMQAIWPTSTYRNIGITPMIGLNDSVNETFSLADADQVLGFALANDIGRLAFWSVNRDRQCTVAASTPRDDCSGTTQAAYAFSARFAAAR